MERRPNILERAFELARSGECAGMLDIRRRLIREGYCENARLLQGQDLRRQLKTLCDEASKRHGALGSSLTG